MQVLSKMQQKIYDYIVSCIQGQGYPPSVREIGEAVGLKSPSTVHFHLKHLEDAWWLVGRQTNHIFVAPVYYSMQKVIMQTFVPFYFL